MFWLFHKEHGAKLFKDGEIESDLIKQGWADTTDKLEAVQILDRELLKKEADELGIDYPSNVKTDKLSKLIAEAKGE